MIFTTGIKKKIFYLFLTVLLLNTFNYLKLELSSEKSKNLLKIDKETKIEQSVTIELPNPHKQIFLINPKYEICKENPILVAYLFSAPQNFEKRLQIRNTWGNVKKFKDFKILFALALSKNETINERIRKESSEYNDIIQEDYIDSYYNLTTKFVMCMKWSSIYCKNAKFILRINEDMIINTFELVEYLKNLSKNDINLINTLYGQKIHPKPIRNKKSKFYVSYDEFPNDRYSPFMSGSAYILTSDLAFKFYNTSLYLYHPPFSVWLEDVYVGMLAEKINVNLVNIIEYYSYYRPDEIVPLKVVKQLGDNQKLFFIYVNKPEEYENALRKLNI